jgi:antitoxin (DNA-binding transcriptional repressor) of toxin-antitoxin stability system
MAYLATMRSVKIAQAKNEFSRHIRYVKAGGRVRIYDRDEAVADLVPVQDEPEASGWTEKDIEDLIQQGLVRPPKKRGPIPESLLRGGPKDPKGLVLAALIEDRRRGR